MVVRHEPACSPRVETFAGQYAVAGATLAPMWPRPEQDVADHTEVHDALERQAAPVVEVATIGDLPEFDRERVRTTHRWRFSRD